MLSKEQIASKVLADLNTVIKDAYTIRKAEISHFTGFTSDSAWVDFGDGVSVSIQIYRDAKAEAV